MKSFEKRRGKKEEFPPLSDFFSHHFSHFIELYVGKGEKVSLFVKYSLKKSRNQDNLEKTFFRGSGACMEIEKLFGERLTFLRLL